MVAPHPDLQRKFGNTDNIVRAKKHYLVPGLHTKYPQDYLDLIIHDKISKIKPWVETIPKKKSQTQKLQPPIIDKILILCVDFSDRPAILPTSIIYDRFFSDTGKSFKNYYSEVSYNQYVPDGEVHGWYTAPYSSTWYTAGNYGLGSLYPFNTAGLVADVLDIARNDSSINWASFDTDSDGYLNSVIIVHSGAEAAFTGNTGDFWAHVSSIPFPITIQGKTIVDYACSAEYIAPYLDQVIGIDCHEFGHLRYLPDLYDYSGNSNGVGDFSLMGSGSWAGYIADTPTHLDAWSKYFIGWSNTIENPVGIVNIETAQLNSTNYKYTTVDPLEYFMVENRQTILFDSYLPAYGLLIWHINERQQYNDNELCFKVGLIQADNLKDLENQINSGDGGDSYPGWTNNHSFGSSAIPNSSLCNSTTKDMLINNISDPANIMSFNSYLPTSPLGSIKFAVYPPASDIYFDTIYKGTTDPVTGILIINDIPIGMINYTVKKTGYYDRSDSVEVIVDTTVIVSIILIVIPGTVNMTSTPSGAKIYMDDIDTGQITPATITNLSVGSHTYKLTYSGYYDKTGSFLISAGQMLNIDVNLIQITKGELNITSNPIGAKIYIDDIDTFQTTPATIPNLDEGTYTYKLTLTGYYDKTDTFDIIAGYTNMIDAGNLTPLPPTTGTLYITSNPIGAEIYINDINKQITTPAIILDLLPGNYTYKLTLIGYKDKIGTFDIIANQTTIVDTGDLEMIVAEAGMGAAGMILVASMLVGSIYSSMKKPELSKV